MVPALTELLRIRETTKSLFRIVDISRQSFPLTLIPLDLMTRFKDIPFTGG
jgi:hypothetical protein